MAKVLGLISASLSGNLDGLVFVKMNGKTYVRTMPDKRNANSWSEKQTAARSSFRFVILYAKRQKELVIKPIWNKPAKELNMNGFNLFVKTNRAAFDSLGKVIDPGLLHFSTGQLPLSYLFRAEVDIENPKSIAVTWTDPLVNKQYNDDCLMAVTYQDGPSDPFNTGYTRKDLQARIPNHYSSIKDVYLYLFFWNQKLDIYSPDHVIIIKHT